MSDNALDNADSFEFFLFTFLVQKKCLNIFPGEPRSLESGFPSLIGFDVVVDSFESTEALEELVCFVCIVEM